jgi:DNA-binding response OmpR family regulator
VDICSLEYLIRYRGDASRNTYPGPQVACVPTFLFWLAALGKVLILAREEVVAALLGLMVELKGLKPMYLGKADTAEDTIRRERPAVVVVDCDHQDCTDSLLAAVRESGAKPILFSPFRFDAEVRRVAARHGVECFTLPTDPETFGRMLNI